MATKQSKIQNPKSKMKVTVLGGGPGGLYAAILLKKANPDLDITVWERNPRGATFGWGVVFSDRTLSAFREADYKSYVDITNRFVLWEAIDTYYKGERIRCGGHTFAGLGRRELLLILQARCAELGVKMNFEVEITDPGQYATESDFVIAADGINSITRKTYSAAFKPSLDVRKAKFAWYGTNKVFDSFTFIFQESDYGLFQAHCYPFDGETSTFIIECDEEVWRRAGLDQMNEDESLRYCEKIFADYLGGRGLMSNRSLWINFTTVKNKKWSHQNIVLMGDAVHTAHFSIGSGTKLAMEDAVAFANAFERYGSDNLAAVFKDYEAERRPVTERLQAAAQESLTYFENVKRYTHLDPLQFTFHMLTRSGRISYNNLQQRDPYFSEAVTRWFKIDAEEGTATSQAVEERIIAQPPLFAPLTVRQMTLPNRVVLRPLSNCPASDGLPTESYQRQLLRRAKGGVGLVMVEPVAVSAEGRITPADMGLYRPEHAAAWRDIVKAVHAESRVKIGVQLNHAGRRGATRPRAKGLDRPLKKNSWPLLSASSLPYTPYSQTPKAMTRADMDSVREAFTQAAKLADETGFDWLQLHFAHGYLLASFLSPLTNQRQDDYGGPLENRLRFPLEIFEAVRAIWPASKPLSVAIPASDWADDGFQVEEAVILAQALKASSGDVVEILAGQTAPQSKPNYDPYFLVPYSEQIRHEAGIRTMVSGGLTITDQINSILAGGRADLCVMDPPHLKD